MKRLSIQSVVVLFFLFLPFLSPAQFVIIGDSVTTTYVSLDPDSVCVPSLPDDTVYFDIDNNGINDFKLKCVVVWSPSGPHYGYSFQSINGSMLFSMVTMGDSNCDSIIDANLTLGAVPEGDSVFNFQPDFTSQILPFHTFNGPWCWNMFGIVSFPAYIPFQMQSGNNILVGWFRLINQVTLDSYAYNSIPVSVPENSEIQYSIYPNPATNDFNIRFERTDRFNISVKDITGRTIFSQIYEGNHFQTDLGKFSKGIYLLEIESGQTRVSEKIVIR